MVLMVALTIAIFGVLALSLDMGYTYYIRRWAQNAADSGALAAARELCIEPDLATGKTNATNAAIDYIENKNLAFGVNSQTMTNIIFGPDGGLEAGEAQVDVAINHPNFVASFFGRDSTTVPATAAAGCFAPSAAFGVIPIAWLCNLEDDEGEEVCDMTYISADDECIFTDDYMYIFIESVDEFFWCEELGSHPTVPEPSEVITMTCGTNLEIVNTAHPEHSWPWVDLDGGIGKKCATDELIDWVNNGFEGTIPINTWVPSCTGEHTSVYGVAAGLDESTIPIFDLVCNSYDARNECDGPEPTYPDLWQDDVDTDLLPLVTNTEYTFHLISFAKLRISCVDAQGNKCDQDEHARHALDIMNPGILKNKETIEGCFIGGFIPGLKGDPSAGVGEGAWTLYLTR